MHSLAAHAMPGARSHWRSEAHGEADAVGRYRFLLLLRFAADQRHRPRAAGRGLDAGLDRADPGGRRHPHLQADLRPVRGRAGLVGAARCGCSSRELNALDVGPSAGPSKIAAFMHGIAGRDGHTRQALAGVPAAQARAPDRAGAAHRQHAGAARPDRHHHRLRHRALGRQPGRRDRRRRDRPDGRDAAARHGHGAVQDPGRLGAQRLADGRLPAARGRRRPSPDPRDRGGRAHAAA